MLPGNHWRAPGNANLSRIYNQNDQLDQVLAGGAPGVNAGAFGGRAVQLPDRNYVVHPMMPNMAPMASPQPRQVDPGMWFAGQPQPFNAQAYVDNNSQRINAGQMRAVANMRDDGGVQLRGGGRYMDPAQAAMAFNRMGGNAAIGKDGNVTVGGRPMDGAAMFQALMQQRGDMRNAKEQFMANNSRIRNAWSKAGRGNVAPLMAAMTNGLIQNPGQQQAGGGKGFDFMANAAQNIFGQLNPQQQMALMGRFGMALNNGDMNEMNAVMQDAAGMNARNEEVKKKAVGVPTTVQPGDHEMASGFPNGDEASAAMLAKGMNRDRVYAAVTKAHPGWKPQHAGWHQRVNPQTGRLEGLHEGPLGEIGTWMNPLAGIVSNMIGNWANPGPQPQAPAQPAEAPAQVQAPEVPGSGWVGPAAGGAFRQFWGGGQAPAAPQQPGPAVQPRFAQAPGGLPAAPYRPGSLNGRFTSPPQQPAAPQQPPPALPGTGWMSPGMGNMMRQMWGYR